MSAQKTGSRRRAKRMQVMDEATRALNRRGISHASLSEISERVGVSRAALYYYFEDQQDLVFQCYVRSCEQMARRLSEARHQLSSAPEQVDLFVTLMLSADEPEFASLSEPAFLRQDQRNTILGLYEALRSSLAELLDNGIQRREVRPCHSELVAAAIIGLLSWVPPSVHRWDRLIRLSDREVFEELRSTILEGIAADRSAPVSYPPFSLSPLALPAVRVFDPVALGEARKEAILAAASWLFNLKGPEATSLEEIAERLGVTKKVIYNNVGDKQTLMTECFRRAIRIYLDIGKRMEAYEGPRVDAISASAHVLAEASLREDIAPFRPFTGLEARPPEEQEELNASVKSLSEIYQASYNQGIAEKSIRESNARAVLECLPGLVEWLPQWFDAFDEDDRARAPREMAELFRLGLRPI